MGRYDLRRVLTRKDFPAFAQHVLLPAVLIILLLILSIYGVRSYILSYEKKVASSLHGLIDDFENIEFEEGTLAYEEEMTQLAEGFMQLYEQAKRSYNGKRALYHAGMTYYVLGEFDRAAELLDELFMRSKKFYLAPQALYFRALALEEAKRYEEALSALMSYEEYYSDSSFLTAEVQLAKGRNYMWLADYTQAEAVFSMLIKKSEADTSLLASSLEQNDTDASEQTYHEKAQELLDLMNIIKAQQSS
ncbi:hypothetical protein COTS27_00168 [Spirochaetota bacterium]|nr:hypothetical protein COTS27_00168 [Spirochaetota bacterium]